MNYDPRRPLTVENELGLQVVPVTIEKTDKYDAYARYLAAKAYLADPAWFEALKHGRSN